MNLISILNNKRIWIIVAFNLLFIITISFVGCTNKFGRIQPSGEVTRMFETYQIFPDHKYYYSGSDGKPRGIIGIHNNYTLNSKLWKPVDLTPEQLRNWINFILSDITVSANNYGALILDSNGNQVGVWYSLWRPSTVKMENDNSIIVHTPTEENIRLPRKKGL
ncbi:hypothetical protein ACFL7E_07445 [Thermodesulfobacteriota bacterium]